MMTATATGFTVNCTPRPVRIEKDAKVIKVVENFISGKELAPTRRHRRAIALLSAALAGIEAYIILPSQAVLAAPANEAVIPKEVDVVLLKIQLVCLGLCVSVGVIMAMIAGFFRIIGLREEARKRYADAVMGMIQVLTAPVVLGIIATIVRGLLHLFPGYVS